MLLKTAVITNGVSWKANKLFGFGAWAFSRSDSRDKNNVHHVHQPAMWPVNFMRFGSEAIKI